MSTHAVSAGTLQHLSTLPTHGAPVLSLYLDLDPGRFPTPAERSPELSALLSHAGANDADAGRVLGLLAERPELTRGAAALAVFSCAEHEVLEAVPLPESTEPAAVVDQVPWLEPIAAMLTRENWGVAVVAGRSTRLFRGGPRSLVEFATFSEDAHPDFVQEGWPQGRTGRGPRSNPGRTEGEEQIAVRARHAAGRLQRAHRRRPFDHLVVVASEELWPAVEASLDPDLHHRLAGHIALDLEHAPGDEIARAVTPVVEAAERRREHELFAQLEEGLGIGGPAAAGLDEVLSTLEQHRVQVLLVAEGASLVAGRCPRCGRLSASCDGVCPLDGSPLGVVDAVDHAIEAAARDGAEILVPRDEAERATLRDHGSIAALLRW
jgi:hypothetical protein